MIYISRVLGLGLGLINFGHGLKKFLWARPPPHSLWPWPRAKLASLTSLVVTAMRFTIDDKYLIDRM